MIFGLDSVPLPDGYTPLEAECVIKCLDENGEVTLLTRGTSGLMSWDAVGMLTVALDVARAHAVSGFESDDDEDDED